MFQFSHNRDRGNIIVGWILTVFSFSVVWTRLYTRVILTRSFGSDDVFITIPSLLQFFEATGDTLDFRHGFGQHEWTLNEYEKYQLTKWEYINWLAVFISYFFIRTSVMLFVLRLLPRYKIWQARIVLLAFVLNLVITLFALISYGLSCIPFNANWKKTPGAKCLSMNIITASQLTNGIVSCIVDIMTALVPQFLLYKVQMRKKTKRILNLIFGLGIITAALSVGRAATWSAKDATEDPTWRVIPSGSFGLYEEKFGLIVASLPAIRQLVVHYHRHGSIAPSSRESTPGGDFIRMRHRITLRDLFWYRAQSDQSPSLPTGASRASLVTIGNGQPPRIDGNAIHKASEGQPLDPKDTGAEESILTEKADKAKEGIHKGLEHGVNFIERVKEPKRS